MSGDCRFSSLFAAGADDLFARNTEGQQNQKPKKKHEHEQRHATDWVFIS